MAFLVYFVSAGSALVGLLFVANAMLPARGPLGISTEFHGVQAALHGEFSSAARSTAPAPEPDMKSEAVKLAKQGAPGPALAVNIEPVNQAVSRVEPAPKKRKPVARPREAREQMARPREWREQYAQAPEFGWNGGNDRAGRNDAWRNDFGRNDFGRNDPWRSETRRNDAWRNDAWRNDPWQNNRHGRWDGR